jgi:hypothetical protein
MGSLQRSTLIALASLLASTSVLSEFSAPHYLGSSRDRSEFRMYVGGGEFLGRNGSLQTIKVTVHQLRVGQRLKTLEGCVYRFDDMDWRRDRIECSQETPGPLRGVEYARDAKQFEKGVSEREVLTCVRRCGPQVPQRLRLEDADEDNG